MIGEQKMANMFQKIIYYFSAISPIGIVFSLVWVIQKKTYLVLAIVMIFSLFFILLFVISFEYGKKRLAPISIRVTDVSANDIWILGYILSYLLPLVSIIIEECNFTVLAIVASMLGCVIPFMNSAMPHPLLYIKKYHFYQLATENGISSYVLISKRKIRNKKEIKAVGRMFDFLLIEK